MARSGRNVGRTTPGQPDSRICWCQARVSVAESVVQSTSIRNRSKSARGRKASVRSCASMRS